MQSQDKKPARFETDLSDEDLKRIEAAFRAGRRLKDLRGALLQFDEHSRRQRDSLLLEINAADLAYRHAAMSLQVRVSSPLILGAAS